jgi:hypothetical protein
LHIASPGQGLQCLRTLERHMEAGDASVHAANADWTIRLVCVENRNRRGSFDGWSDASLYFYFTNDPDRHVVCVTIAHTSLINVRNHLASFGSSTFETSRSALALLCALGEDDDFHSGPFYGGPPVGLPQRPDPVRLSSTPGVSISADVFNALRITTAAAVPFVEFVFRNAHVRVLQAQADATISVDDAPSMYIPPDSKPCARDHHVPSTNPGCAKCQRRADCESLDGFASAFSALHVTGKMSSLCWGNSDARVWATPGQHLQVAKLFGPKMGNHDQALEKTTFEILDGTALFNIISWCVEFHSDYIGPDGAGQAAAKARNTAKHRDDLNFTERERDEVIAGLRVFLERLAHEDGPGMDDIANGAKNALSVLNALQDRSRLEFDLRRGGADVRGACQQ